MITRLFLAACLCLACDGAARAQDQSRPKERDAPPPAATTPAPTPPATSAPSAAKLHAAQERIRGEIHRQALARAQTVQTEGGRVMNYRDAPSPRAVAICVFWDDITPNSVPTGSFGAAWGNPQAAERALGFCNRFKAQRGQVRCECSLADQDGVNRVQVPPAVIARVAAATP